MRMGSIIAPMRVTGGSNIGRQYSKVVLLYVRLAQPRPVRLVQSRPVRVAASTAVASGCQFRPAGCIRVSVELLALSDISAPVVRQRVKHAV